MTDKNTVAKANVVLEADINPATTAVNELKGTLESVEPVVDQVEGKAAEAIDRTSAKLDQAGEKAETVAQKTRWFFTRQAEEAGEDIRREADKVEQKIGSGFDGSSDKIKGSTEQVRKFTSAITGTVGAATGLIAVVTLLIGVFIKIGKSMIERAKEVRRLSDEFSTLQDRIQMIDPGSLISQMTELQKAEKAMRDEIWETNQSLENKIKLDEEMVKSIERAKVSMRDAGYKESADRIRDLDKAVKDLGKSTRDAGVTDPIMKETLAFEAQHAAVTELVRERDRLAKSVSGTDFDAGSNAVFEKQARDAIDKNHATNISNIKKEIAERERLEKEAIDKKLDAEYKNIEKAHQRELELDKKRAEAIAKAVESALAPVLASLSTSFGSGFTTKLDTIIAEVTEATSALRDMR